jgi:hypothetical protein
MSVLIEHKLVTVLAITLIFLVSGLLFSFLKGYSIDTITNIETAGQNTPFRQIQWVGAIN